MSEAVIVALITSTATVIAEIIISRREWQNREKALIEQGASVNLRLERLEKAVEKQSEFAERIYKTEADMSVLRHCIDAQNKIAERRII